MSLYGVLPKLSPEQSSEPERAIDARGESCSRVLRHRAFARRGVLLLLLLMWSHIAASILRRRFAPPT